jgi:membrane-bound lytic murein transglycosylase
MADNEQYFDQFQDQIQESAQDGTQSEQVASSSSEKSNTHLQEQSHRQGSRTVQEAEVFQQEGSQRQASGNSRAAQEVYRQASSTTPTYEEVQQRYERASRPEQERHESLDDYSERMSRYFQHAATQDIYIPDTIQIKTYIEGLYRVSDQKIAWEIVDREPDIRLSKLGGTLYFECGNAF